MNLVKNSTFIINRDHFTVNKIWRNAEGNISQAEFERINAPFGEFKMSGKDFILKAGHFFEPVTNLNEDIRIQNSHSAIRKINKP